jgi:proteasome lid subunit RPN8/RPN11
MVERIIVDTIEKARQYCEQLDLDYYPSLVDTIPDSLEAVSHFIAQRGRKDLPASQFEGRVDENNPGDLVEMSGVLTYGRKSGIHEVGYNSPEKSDVVMRDGKWTRTEMGCSQLIDICDIPKDAEIFIDYHSHPIGPGELSAGDVQAMGKFNILIEIMKGQRSLFKSHYFGIFAPESNRTVWYQICDRGK